MRDKELKDFLDKIFNNWKTNSGYCGECTLRTDKTFSYNKDRNAMKISDRGKFLNAPIYGIYFDKLSKDYMVILDFPGIPAKALSKMEYSYDSYDSYIGLLKDADIFKEKNDTFKAVRKFLYESGFDSNEFYYTNAKKCGVQYKSMYNILKNDNSFRKCYPYLKKEIELIRPKLFLTFGKISLRMMAKHLKYQQGLKIEIINNEFNREFNEKDEKEKPILIDEEGFAKLVPKDKEFWIWNKTEGCYEKTTEKNLKSILLNKMGYKFKRINRLVLRAKRYLNNCLD
ncbi:MAG: hypothetical protein EU549_05360, partial [Promethearchaeota archaeon]